jgi:hypothetical protein
MSVPIKPNESNENSSQKLYNSNPYDSKIAIKQSQPSTNRSGLISKSNIPLNLSDLIPPQPLEATPEAGPLPNHYPQTTHPFIETPAYKNQ